MEISAIGLLPQEIVNAIGTALFYSLGQGVVLAAITAIIVLCTRNLRPSIRYNWLAGAMFVFFVVSLATFGYAILQYKSYTPSPVVLQGAELPSLAKLSPTEVSFPDKLQFYLKNYEQTLVMIWLLIVLARCFQLSIGLNRLSHLRKNSNLVVDPLWTRRLNELAASLGIQQLVELAESSLTKVPMVIGHFKPLILLPIGLLTAIPPQQIEAILVHELAHVQRRDYLVNLLQRLMEILYFFNPAVLWLSALIKTERENCCDDMAINQTHNKFNYISALVSCQEYKAQTPEYAMAFSKKEQLKARVHRLVYNSNHSLNKMEKALLVLCLGLVGFGSLAFSNVDRIEQAIVKQTERVRQTVTETESTQPITKSQLALQPLRAKTTVANLFTNVLDTDSVNIKKHSITSEHTRLARLDSIQQQFKVLNDSSKRLGGKLSPLHHRVGRINGIASTAIDKVEHAQTALSDAITQDLIKDGIIKRIDDQLSFKLSTNELVVQGKLLSSTVHQKYKEKYVPVVEGKQGVWTLYYNHETSTKTTTQTKP